MRRRWSSPRRSSGGEPPAFARILDRALEGRELTREEGVALAEAGPEVVGPLAVVADEVHALARLLLRGQIDHRHGLVEGLTVLLLEINRRYKRRGTGIRVTGISDGDQVTG